MATEVKCSGKNGCQTTWIQRGNRTGHCAKCHESFEGVALFDAHLELHDDGSATHLDPAEMTYRKEPLRYVDGSWRGPEMDKGVFARE